MKKIIFTNAHIVDPTQKINKLGSLTVENEKIVNLSFNNRSLKKVRIMKLLIVKN